MRQAAVKSISATCSKYLHVFPDSNFEAALQNDPTFFCVMAKHRLTSVCARLVAFVKNLLLTIAQVATHLQVGNRAAANFAEFIARIEILFGGPHLCSEELGK